MPAEAPGVVLHVAPHPDDELIGAPAILFALRDAGWRIVNLACSVGRPDQRARRLAELEEACRRARFELIVPNELPGLGANDDLERTQRELAMVIGEQLRRSPRCLLSGPSPHDGHHGHEVVGRAITDAVEHVALAAHWLIWGVWRDLPFPNLLVEFGAERMLEIKHALEAHAGELARADYLALVEARARMNAILGQERIHGFGSPRSRMPFAELVTQVTFTSAGWELAPSRDFVPENVLDQRRGTPVGWWLHSESVSQRRRAEANVGDVRREDATAARIVRVTGPPELDELGVLYGELHAHQAAGAPSLGALPARGPDEAWRLRRRRYHHWLEQEGSFLLTASIGPRIAAFILVTVASGYDGWGSGERLGEIRELIVAAQDRGRGIGSSLLDAAERELARLGIGEYRLNVVAGNASAEQFYARRGLVPVAHVMLGRTSRPVP